LKHGFEIIVPRAHKNGAFKIERHELSPANEEVFAGAHILQSPSHSSAAHNDGGSHSGRWDGDGGGGGHGGEFESECGYGWGRNGKGE